MGFLFILWSRLGLRDRTAPSATGPSLTPDVAEPSHQRLHLAQRLVPSEG